jgi:hypothetical protein
MRRVIEIDDSFYEQYERINLKLGEAERDIVYYTDGLSVLERQLMAKVDEEFYAKEKKRLPEYLQRREAKRHPDYINMVRAKATAIQNKTILKGQLDLLKMKFDEWRTRRADSRGSY